MTGPDEPQTTDAEREALIASLRAELADRDRQLAEQKSQYGRLEATYQRLLAEMALLKRRIFVATAERVDTSQLQLEFAALSRELDALSGLVTTPDDVTTDAPTKCPKCGKVGPCKCRKPSAKKPTGKRNVADANLPEERVEIRDPLFEQLVAEGKAEFLGFDESSKVAVKVGGLRRVVQLVAKYRAVNARGETELESAPVPKEILPRCLAAPSTLAHILVAKYCDGLPLYRVEQIFERMGFGIDRGTMSRWVHDLGQYFGASVIHAAHEEAIRTAFCILTDATGFSIQRTSPEARKDFVRSVKAPAVRKSIRRATWGAKRAMAACRSAPDIVGIIRSQRMTS